MALLLLPAQALACSIAMGPMQFGVYNFNSSTPLDTISSLKINCPAGTPFQFSLERSAGAGPLLLRAPGTVTPLKYNLYLDAARSQVWGDGTGGTQIGTGLGTGSPTSVVVYGRIPSGQAVSAGQYSNQITITLIW